LEIIGIGGLEHIGYLSSSPSQLFDSLFDLMLFTKSPQYKSPFGAGKGVVFLNTA
jgi:hypothetical protein